MQEAIYFSYVWPEPRSSAAGLRSLDILKLLQENWKVTAFSPSKQNIHSEELNRLGITTHSCAANESTNDPLFRSLQPELVVFDRFVMEEQFGWKCREFWPEARYWIDTQDLHSLRRLREQNPQAKNPNPNEFGEDLLREIASLLRVDGALVVSNWEKNWLDMHFPLLRERVHYLPLFAETAPGLSYSERADFAFLGNFRHPPNLDAVHHLASTIWPRLRAALPEARLHLYGAYPPASVSALGEKNGIAAHGPVHDHRAALSQHRVFLAPLRFGAGAKGKVLEAWATGTPVAGSEIAFEGMAEGVPGALEFLPTAIRLYQDETFWQEASEWGLERVRNHFRAALWKRELHRWLAAPKTQDFYGRMLRHQSLNATKYFSRWIEAKNQGRPMRP